MKTARRPRRAPITYLVYQRMCGVLIVLLLLAQLYHFEQLPSALIEWGLPNHELLARVVAMALTGSELMALPYLIGMPLRPVILRISRGAVLGVGLLWVVLAAWAIGAGVDGAPAAIFGTTLSIIGGNWVLGLAMLLATLLALTVYDPDRLVRRYIAKARR